MSANALRVALSGLVAAVALAGVTPVRAGAVTATSPTQTETTLAYYTTTSEQQAPPVRANDHVVLVATVTPVDGDIPATGTVAFVDGSIVLGVVVLQAHLTTSYAILFSTPLLPGVHDVVADYSGAGTFSPSGAGPIQITVAPHHEPAMTGTFIQGGVTIIDAHGAGPAATGDLELDGFFHAVVTCLQVSGTHGIATTVIDSSQDPRYPVGEIVVAEGIDNGVPTLNAAPDLWRNSFQSNGGIHQVSGRCWLPFFPPVGIQQGNIVVVDGD
jgi:Bacterial Ig-like domain (group 3)